MIADLILDVLTSNLVLAALAAASTAALAGAWLGLIPPGYALLASAGGRAALIVLCVLFGYRLADERHETKALKFRLEIAQRDLKAEQDARAQDLLTLDRLNTDKTRAEQTNADLKDHIDKLPKDDQCLATPDRLRRLHRR